MIIFVVLLQAFDFGYRRVGWAEDWPIGPYRWAFEMGRKQSKGARP